MRRMLLPEVKIKSKILDDKNGVLLTEFKKYMKTRLGEEGQSVIIQVVSQYTRLDGGIFLDAISKQLEVTNQILTITYSEFNFLVIRGFMMDDDTNTISTMVYEEDVDADVENFMIYSNYPFDVYVIEQD